ncbi:MAG: 4-(cytidine 5'-diphospho)-2-C-methyl-D-erythritol kinase [Rickettsiales bacterium]|jgi:4-diphosphocytidyl-2-C-methyl-D-erythritol kinase|nr:4-(cytidine 5'-diphospho)-2-C-methyl-D-erythritol kinase [Rickettsiales bacterium]
MQLKAPAKLNLYLHITGRRPDGYHLLDSLVSFLDLSDELFIEASPELKLELSGPFSQGLSEQDNLVLDAVRLVRKNFNIDSNVKILLKKNIPFGAGLGGGSSDAASVLLGLNDLWKLNLSDKQLAEIAIQLGSDVVVCLGRRPAYINGIGEIIEPCSIHFNGAVLLVNPKVMLPTSSVYKAFGGSYRPLQPKLKQLDRDALIRCLQSTSNDLTGAAITLCPSVGDVLENLALSPGLVIARMSGSGSTCFGIYEDLNAARAAMEWLKIKYPDYWYHVAQLRSYA